LVTTAGKILGLLDANTIEERPGADGVGVGVTRGAGLADNIALDG
jgi:hypothetical protein